ncbi:MAG: hybrid sensor histidine kinase/response regulator [Bacteroidales bacterium]|nr:hybrid sensor histidine kinase/response regulator [Bacteroidales bacterium]
MKNKPIENKRILIVDDNPKNLQILGNILKQSGYKLEFATDGVQAIDWLKNTDFDLILLDIMMPVMDGFEACRRIRENYSKDKLPIIFLTAKTDNESIINGFKLGGQDYITKPFDSHELLARVNTHIELKISKQKLHDTNKWLEEQVALRTQELQIAYHELEQLDVAKIEFLKIISHEIRTPLNGIKGFTQLLKLKVESEELLGYINIIERSSQRLERFSNIALLISSLRTKKHPIKFSEVSIDELLNKAVKVAREQFENKFIDYVIKPYQFEFKTYGDPELLTECFIQVIENASIYSPDRGKVLIYVSEDNSNITISIKDAGPGFSDEALQSIFKPFGLGQDHIDKKVGLGLHLVKLIIETHKATIKIGNNNNGGSYVDIILPKNVVFPQENKGLSKLAF